MRTSSHTTHFLHLFRSLLSPAGDRFYRKRLLSPFVVVAGLLIRQLEHWSLRVLSQQLSASYGIPRCAGSSWCRAAQKLDPALLDSILDKSAALARVTYKRLRKRAKKLGCTGRLLAIDGSKFTIPCTPELVAYFHCPGYRPWKSATSQKGHYPLGKLVVLYDILAQRPVSYTIQPHDAKGGEIAAAQALIATMQAGDVVVMDRAYPSLALMRAMAAQHVQYVVRMRRGKQCWRAIQSFDKEGARARKVTVSYAGNTVTCRFIRGYCTAKNAAEKDYIVATNVVESVTWIRRLYAMRWTIESFFRVLKENLGLELLRSKTKVGIQNDVCILFIICQIMAIIEHVSAHTYPALPDTRHQKIERTALMAAIPLLIALWLRKTRHDNHNFLTIIQQLHHTAQTAQRTRPGRQYKRECKRTHGKTKIRLKVTKWANS